MIIVLLIGAVLLFVWLGATGRLPMGWVAFKIAPVLALFALAAAGALCTALGG